MKAVVAELLHIIHELRPTHCWCDGDNWYSCPKAPDGCADDSKGTDCTCGADQQNAALDKRLKELGVV